MSLFYAKKSLAVVLCLAAAGLLSSEATTCAAEGSKRAANFTFHVVTATLNYEVPASLTLTKGMVTGYFNVGSQCTVDAGSTDIKKKFNVDCTIPTGGIVDRYVGTLSFATGKGAGQFTDPFYGIGTYTATKAQ